MAVLSIDIKRLRRMVAELDDTTYKDEDLALYIEIYPAVDSMGRSSDEDEWTEGYDLHAAAASIWEEKAASVASKHDFSADGASFTSSQLYEQYMDQSRYHWARTKATAKSINKRPVETTSDLYLGYIANMTLSDENGFEELP